VPLQLVEFFQTQITSQALCSEELGLAGFPVAAGRRFRIHYGNPISGRAHNEQDTGHLELSITPPAILIFPSKRAKNGRAVLIDSVIKVDDLLSGDVLYRHPRYHLPEEKPPETAEPLPNQRRLRRVVTRGRS
jgi:hypothetical protein